MKALEEIETASNTKKEAAKQPKITLQSLLHQLLMLLLIIPLFFVRKITSVAQRLGVKVDTHN
jgi:hypothetical protein